MKPTTNSTTIMTLRQAAEAIGVDPQVTYRALQRGWLTPVDSGTAALHLVTAESVQALGRRYAENPPKPGPPPRQTVTAKGPGVSVPKAARLLNVSRQRVYQLIAQRHLKACAVRPYQVALSSLRKYQEVRR